MRGKTVKKINKYLVGFQDASGVTDTQFKNIRRNVKRIVTRSSGTVEDVFNTLDINSLIERSKWND